MYSSRFLSIKQAEGEARLGGHGNSVFVLNQLSKVQARRVLGSKVMID